MRRPVLLVERDDGVVQIGHLDVVALLFGLQNHDFARVQQFCRIGNYFVHLVLVLADSNLLADNWNLYVRYFCQIEIAIITLIPVQTLDVNIDIRFSDFLLNLIFCI